MFRIEEYGRIAICIGEGIGKTYGSDCVQWKPTKNMEYGNAAAKGSRRGSFEGRYDKADPSL
jgi:hypothetical protein